jgi:hypothetical protein
LAFATFAASVSSSSFTVAVKVFVSLSVPTVIVAVRVTVASPSPNAGLVTVPSLAITSVLSDDQVTLASSRCHL